MAVGREFGAEVFGAVGGVAVVSFGGALTGSVADQPLLAGGMTGVGVVAGPAADIDVSAG
ncbi:hypothetical protein [Cryptosporangium phraense]|uniref:Uncharacterized protein n=1 Tax=Cryptosporangium phraense TaxID=2593070 RepID=A0A545AHW6_9ACTN|nr:hypothetical protein [Cryptosporangium phraense]TQS40909.1 hypothetical protein FL583_32300 [Cryptosporangium phraense]